MQSTVACFRIPGVLAVLFRLATASFTILAAFEALVSLLLSNVGVNGLMLAWSWLNWKGE